MKDLQKLKEKRTRLAGEAKAPMTLAETEKRDVTAEEAKAINMSLDELKECRGEIEKVEAGLELRQRVLDAEIDANRPDPRNLGQPSIVPGPVTDPLREPARARRFAPHKMRAYTQERWGNDAPEIAFRTGQFLLATIGNDPGAREWCGRHGIELRTAQSEGSNLLGGYLVFPEFGRTIIELMEQYGVFRQHANVETMASDTKTVPRRTGGLTAYAIGENTAITESNLAWDQVNLVAKKWACLAKWSSELDEDSIISMADKFTAEIAYAFTKKEDESGFIGDGTSTYHGVVGATVKIDDGTHTASVHDALAGNIAFSSLDLVDFEAVVGKLPQYAEDGAQWFVSKPGFAASMQRLMDAIGGNTMDNLATGVRKQFLGYPVVFSSVLNTTLTDQVSTVLLLFGNLAQAATLGIRRGISVKMSDQRYIELDQLAIQGTTRSAIEVHDLGDTSDAGPLLALKTPGA